MPGAASLPTLATVERVVLRGDHAVVIFKNKESWQDMTLVDGQWKTGNSFALPTGRASYGCAMRGERTGIAR